MYVHSILQFDTYVTLAYRTPKIFFVYARCVNSMYIKKSTFRFDPARENHPTNSYSLASQFVPRSTHKTPFALQPPRTMDKIDKLLKAAHLSDESPPNMGERAFFTPKSSSGYHDPPPPPLHRVEMEIVSNPFITSNSSNVTMPSLRSPYVYAAKQLADHDVDASSLFASYAKSARSAPTSAVLKTPPASAWLRPRYSAYDQVGQVGVPAAAVAAATTITFYKCFKPIAIVRTTITFDKCFKPIAIVRPRASLASPAEFKTAPLSPSIILPPLFDEDDAPFLTEENFLVGTQVIESFVVPDEYPGGERIYHYQES